MFRLGGAFKAFEKYVNKILLSPIRGNIKCPKALNPKAPKPPKP